MFTLNQIMKKQPDKSILHRILQDNYPTHFQKIVLWKKQRGNVLDYKTKKSKEA